MQFWLAQRLGLAGTWSTSAIQDAARSLGLPDILGRIGSQLLSLCKFRRQRVVMLGRRMLGRDLLFLGRVKDRLGLREERFAAAL